MWHKVARLILTYRLPILVVLALITIGLGSQLNKLKLSYGYANLLPPEDPANLEFLELKSSSMMTVWSW